MYRKYLILKSFNFKEKQNMKLPQNFLKFSHWIAAWVKLVRSPGLVVLEVWKVTHAKWYLSAEGWGRRSFVVLVTSPEVTFVLIVLQFFFHNFKIKFICSGIRFASFQPEDKGHKHCFTRCVRIGRERTVWTRIKARPVLAFWSCRECRRWGGQELVMGCKKDKCKLR